MIRRAQPRRLTAREAREVERDNPIPKTEMVPTVGFCEECELRVNEPEGKLHRSDCKGVPPERRRAS